MSARPSRRPGGPQGQDGADTVDVHLPNPPERTPRRTGGRSGDDAQQAAERDVQTGAVDLDVVLAWESRLRYDRLRDAQAAVEALSAGQDRLEAEATGDALVARARSGHGTTAPREVEVPTLAGAKDQVVEATERNDDAAAAHEDAVEVLRGNRPRPDGSRYPGSPVAPGTTRVGVHLLLLRVRELLPLVVPLLVEGYVVRNTMKAYLRTPDADFWSPTLIAISAVLTLTLPPFLIGRTLSRAAHGAVLGLWHRVAVAAGAVVFVATGVLLAVVRVQIDAAEAERKGRELARVSEVPFEPAPFPVVVPTVFWVLTLVGIGVVLICIELLAHNPALAEELETRRAKVQARRRLLVVRGYLDRVAAAGALQERTNAVSAAMWAQQVQEIPARAEVDKQLYRVSLVRASGDSRLGLALAALDAAAEPGRAPSEDAENQVDVIDLGLVSRKDDAADDERRAL